MSLLLFDDRIRELFKLAALRQREVKSLPQTPPIESPPGRCQRIVHPDGRPFWSFTWQSPAQTLAPQGYKPVQAQITRAADSGESQLPAA